MTDAPAADDAADPDDETSLVVTTTAAAPPVQVWDVLVHRSDEWWASPYLAPDQGVMHIEAELGGRVWSAVPETDRDDDRGSRGVTHGHVRAFDPPERLEIGGVLVPGAYAGTITVTIEKTSLGSEIRIEQMARGRIDASVEERITLGWTTLSSALADLAEA